MSYPARAEGLVNRYLTLETRLWLKNQNRRPPWIPEVSRVRRTPEEGRCGNNNKDEDNSLKTFNDENYDSGLLYYTRLCTLTTQIFIYFPRHALMMFCSFVIIIFTYRNR